MSIELRADCARCCGLCCVGPAFDAGQGFGFNKPAHTPCPNLAPNFRCTIHGELRRHGFPSCQTFDCYGAGQRVTQHLFAGQSWKTSPEIAAQMFEAYRKYRSLHELLAILDASPAPQLQELRQSIQALCESGAPGINISQLRSEVLQRIELTYKCSSPADPATGRRSNPTAPGKRSTT
jgi:hypothetical protein